VPLTIFVPWNGETMAAEHDDDASFVSARRTTPPHLHNHDWHSLPSNPEQTVAIQCIHRRLRRTLNRPMAIPQAILTIFVLLPFLSLILTFLFLQYVAPASNPALPIDISWNSHLCGGKNTFGDWLRESCLLSQCLVLYAHLLPDARDAHALLPAARVCAVRNESLPHGHAWYLVWHDSELDLVSGAPAPSASG